MLGFHQTKMGRQFFEVILPKMVQSLGSITTNLERVASALEEQNTLKKKEQIRTPSGVCGCEFDEYGERLWGYCPRCALKISQQSKIQKVYIERCRICEQFDDVCECKFDGEGNRLWPLDCGHNLQDECSCYEESSHEGDR